MSSVRGEAHEAIFSLSIQDNVFLTRNKETSILMFLSNQGEGTLLDFMSVPYIYNEKCPSVMLSYIEVEIRDFTITSPSGQFGWL